MLLDMVFGAENFVTEIVWRRQNAKGLAFTRFASNHDTILMYGKTNERIWNPQYKPHNKSYVDNFYKYIETETGRRYILADLTNPNKDRPNLTYEFLGVTRVWRWTKDRMQKAYEKGLIVQTKPGAVPRLKRYLDEQKGTPVDNIWDDILPISAQAKERLGYPTQKPLALLERIIQASSNPGDVVLDPFCGCGTAVVAAQKLGRQWIGIDITHLAIGLVKRRLEDAFGDSLQFQVIGEPTTLEEAASLAAQDKYQFQWWALGLVGARPAEGKKGADRGIDGRLYFHDDASGKTKQVILSVKGGHVNVPQVRDLIGVVEREKAQMGVFITLEEPTKPMRAEAAQAGFYHSEVWNRDYPRIQILTIAELLEGKGIDMPPMRQVSQTFKRAKKENPKDGEQMGLIEG